MPNNLKGWRNAVASFFCIACLPFVSPAGAAVDEQSFAECPQHFAGVVPAIRTPGPDHLRALCFAGFAVMHSGETRTPIYVAEHMNRQSVQEARSQQRTNQFYEEARLPFNQRARLSSYVRSGYQRGHMAPAGSMPTPEAMAQSFSLANIVPQSGELNGNGWQKIEIDVRRYVRRVGRDVFVITGPAFVDKKGRIGGLFGVTVPSHLFKLVYDPGVNRAWAYWVENRDNAEIGPPISYDQLVKLTGIEFLPGKAPRS